MSTVSVVIWGNLHLKSGLAAARSGQRDLADAQALIRVTASAAVPELSEPSMRVRVSYLAAAQKVPAPGRGGCPRSPPRLRLRSRGRKP